MRHAFTLIELLVVIAIISAVTIATIPMILPALDSRRIRESARIFSTQLASAQSEAMSKDHSVGVWIQRLSSEPTAAMDIFMCEVPQPYAGDSTGSLCTCKFANGKGTVTLGTDTGWYGLLKPGDLIRFNYGGAYYQFTGQCEQSAGSGTLVDGTQESPAGSGNFVLKPDNTLGFQVTWTNPANPTFQWPATAASAGGWQAPYQIFRQPVKSSSSPIQLPAGAVVDLFYSGTGSGGFLGTPSATDAKNPIILTFDRTGALDSGYVGGVQTKATNPIYFLIGKREKLPAPAYAYTDDVTTQAEKHNFRDTENIWISVAPQTGLVSTTEVAQFDDTAAYNALKAAISPTNPTQQQIIANAVQLSRQFATSAQSMGGR